MVKRLFKSPFSKIRSLVKRVTPLRRKPCFTSETVFWNTLLVLSQQIISLSRTGPRVGPGEYVSCQRLNGSRLTNYKRLKTNQLRSVSDNGLHPCLSILSGLQFICIPNDPSVSYTHWRSVVYRRTDINLNPVNGES